VAAHPLRKKASVDTGDVQGLVLQGYGKHRAAAYVVLQVTDPGRARAWLTSVLDEVSLGPDRPADTALNLAFTAAGLRHLGLPAETIDGFSPEFLEGMTSAHRSRLLGDEGPAAPEQWWWGGPGDPEVHVLLLLFARDDAGLATALERHRTSLSGLRVVVTLETRDIGLGEHFGFRDGLSQPAMKGVGRPAPSMHTIAPGEFLLGYVNEHGQLPRSPRAPGGLDFGRNGSYLVARTLEQDVGAFWRYADHATRRPDDTSDPDARTRLASRMVGRWPSGAPLTMSPDVDRPEIATDNDFGYHAEDSDGFRCPVGAHVRRTNPRDSLPPKPGTSTSVDVGKRHRLIRRGRPFGPPVTAEESILEPEHLVDRGLHFLALCSDIARQFEFISHTWAMNPAFAGLLDDADPLLGGHAARGRSFTVQGEPVRRRYEGVPAFVTVRGGAYFFLPGGQALRFLARS
jgi:Dyp-type peroxidase family